MESKSMIISKITNALGVREKKVDVLPKLGLTDLIQSVISSQKENRAPFYVLDMGVVEALFQEWTNALPTVRPFYAVKCNPHPAFLGALAALGAGFDCASRAEIEAVLALGVSPDRIIYANPCKAECDIKYAASVGVNLTTFDSVGEIEKMRKWHPKCELLIRIKGSEDDGAIQLGTKFGALPEEIKPLLLTAQAAGLTIVGVSFHIGSGATQFTAFDGSIAMAKTIFETANLLGMPRMSVLNIGGGFTAGKLFPIAASSVKTALQTYFADEPDLTVMAEPGRFFAATAFTLAATIIGTRNRGDVREYWINDGAYGSMMMIIFRLNEYITNVIPLACTSNPKNVTGKGEKMYGSTVFGPTCDARDMIMKDHMLPELQMNDWLVFPNMGAYSSAAGSNFNGFMNSAISTHLAYSFPN